MDFPINNKHLSKIILNYINTSIPYKNELLYDTYGILSYTENWYTYSNYIINIYSEVDIINCTCKYTSYDDGSWNLSIKYK
jgi:hypothetical protein